MRSPLGALPSVKLKVKNTLKVWAVAQVSSKVTDSTIAMSLIEIPSPSRRGVYHSDFSLGALVGAVGLMSAESTTSKGIVDATMRARFDREIVYFM
jgi:hypothetical protein